MPHKLAKVEHRFKSPGSSPNGLQATPSGLWCIDAGNETLYKFDYASGDPIFEAKAQEGGGVTEGGGRIWISDSYARSIATYDPQSGEKIAAYDTPSPGVVAWSEGQENAKVTGAHGLEWLDGSLYVSNPPSQMVHVMDPDKWEEVHRFRTPGLRPHGVAWAGDGSLWIADAASGTVCRLDVKDGRVYEVIRVEGPTELHGMTIHEDVLWFCDAISGEIGCLIVD